MTNYKTILNDLKLLIEYKLRTTKTHLIYKKISFNIIDKIEKVLSNTSDENGVKITIKQFCKGVGANEHVITRHLDWLIEESIIWRSKLSFTKTGDKMTGYDIYRYNIHNGIKMTSLKRFVYRTANAVEIEEIKLKDDNLKTIYSALKKITVNIEDALTDLHNSNKKKKKSQSIALYKLFLNNPSITYGTNVNRVYHSATQISSFLHKHLYIDGYKVSEIDAKASQITLISNLTSHIDSKFHNLVQDDFYSWLIKELKANYDEVVTNVTKKGKTRKVKVSIDNIKNKADVKPMVYAAIFGGFKNGTTVSKVMKNNFQNILTELNNIIGDTSLAGYLQNLEALIWISACIELINKGILCIPKHDSLLFDGRYYNVVKEVVTKHYKLNGINNFKLSNDGYVEPNIHKYVQDEAVIEYVFDTIKPSNTDLTGYTFINKDGRVFKGIKSEFVKEYKLDRKNINKLIRNNNKTGMTVKGWKLSSNIT